MVKVRNFVKIIGVFLLFSFVSVNVSFADDVKLLDMMEPRGTTGYYWEFEGKATSSKMGGENSMTMGDIVYTDGIKLGEPASAYFDLDNKYSKLSAFIGLDDFENKKATGLLFYGDNVLIARIEIPAFAKAKLYEIDVEGVKHLNIVKEIGYSEVDLATLKLTKSVKSLDDKKEVLSGGKYMMDLLKVKKVDGYYCEFNEDGPVNKSKDRSMMIGGSEYFNGFRFGDPGSAVFSLKGHYEKLTGIIALDDFANKNDTRIQFIGDGEVIGSLYLSSKMSPQEFEIDVKGVNELLIKKMAGYSEVDFAEVKLYTGNEKQLLEKKVVEASNIAPAMEYTESDLLKDAKPFSTTGYYWEFNEKPLSKMGGEFSMTMDSKKYTNGIKFGEPGTAEIFLDGKYHGIKGIVGLDDFANTQATALSFYGDNVLIKHISIPAKAKAENFDLDLEGIRHLRIIKETGYTEVDLADIKLLVGNAKAAIDSGVKYYLGKDDGQIKELSYSEGAKTHSYEYRTNSEYVKLTDQFKNKYDTFLRLFVQARNTASGDRWNLIEFPLDGQYKSFKSQVAFSGRINNSGATGKFSIILDGKTVAYEDTFVAGKDLKNIDINVVGAQKITFKCEIIESKDKDMEIGLFNPYFTK